MFVYLLWTHNEDGPEDLVATLNKSKVVSMAKAYNANGWFEANEEYDLIEKLENIMEVKGDVVGTYPLMNGWGGLSLQIVELDAININDCYGYSSKPLTTTSNTLE